MKSYLFVYDVPPPKRFASRLFTADEFIAGMQAMGHTPFGFVTEPHLHRDLIGEVRFLNLVGPIRDGVKDGATVIRYETAAVANLLSHD